MKHPSSPSDYYTANGSFKTWFNLIGLKCKMLKTTPKSNFKVFKLIQVCHPSQSKNCPDKSETIFLYTRTSASIAHKKSMWLNLGRGIRSFKTMFGRLDVRYLTSLGSANQSLSLQKSATGTVTLARSYSGGVDELYARMFAAALP